MRVLAFDLGATSGRAYTAELTDKLNIQEVHRFPNNPVNMLGTLHWNIVELLKEVKHGLVKAERTEGAYDSIGIDSWALDFGLLDRNGKLIGIPYHYRDSHTTGMMAKVQDIIPAETIFNRTGIQFMEINTLYQLYSRQSLGCQALEHAESLLMIPDLLLYFLSGEKSVEYTNATTTQLYNFHEQRWDDEIIAALDLPSSIFPEVVRPGHTLGTIASSVQEELSISSTKIISTAQHDTASAVVAISSEKSPFAYLCCGTWSLLGTEVQQPIVTQQALEWNFSNEGGTNDSWRLLKNIMGLWLLERCKTKWEREGLQLTIGELMAHAAASAPFVSIIDPDDSRFLLPYDMPGAISEYCRDTQQQVPSTPGQYVRCILESLALKYRFVLERIELLIGREFTSLHIVGGGSLNQLLCQYTANAIGRPVWAGPVEASAIGNALCQYIGLGKIKNIAEARQIVRQSFPIASYSPNQIEQWNEVYVPLRERWSNLHRGPE